MRLRPILAGVMLGSIAMISGANSPLNAQSGCHTYIYTCSQQPCIRCQHWNCWYETSDGSLQWYSGDDPWECSWSV